MNLDAIIFLNGHDSQRCWVMVMGDPKQVRCVFLAKESAME